MTSERQRLIDDAVVRDGAVADLILQQDCVAISFTWPGGCWAFGTDVGGIDEILAAVEASMEIEPADRDNYNCHVAVRWAALGEFLKDDPTKGSVLCGLSMALWLAARNPVSGAKLRTGIAALIQTYGFAWVLVETDAINWVFTCGPEYTPLADLFVLLDEHRGVPTILEWSKPLPRDLQ